MLKNIHNVPYVVAVLEGVLVGVCGGENPVAVCGVYSRILGIADDAGDGSAACQANGLDSFVLGHGAHLPARIADSTAVCLAYRVVRVVIFVIQFLVACFAISQHSERFVWNVDDVDTKVELAGVFGDFCDGFLNVAEALCAKNIAVVTAAVYRFGAGIVDKLVACVIAAAKNVIIHGNLLARVRCPRAGKSVCVSAGRHERLIDGEVAFDARALLGGIIHSCGVWFGVAQIRGLLRLAIDHVTVSISLRI